MTEIVRKLKAAMAAREIVNGVIQDRRGWKTPQFWLALLTNLAALLGALKGIVDPVVAGVAMAVVSGLYALVRGIQKAQQDGVTRWWRTTEWWMGTAATLSGTLVAVRQAGVDAQWVIIANTILVALLTHSREQDLSQDPAQQPEPKPEEERQ